MQSLLDDILQITGVDTRGEQEIAAVQAQLRKAVSKWLGLETAFFPGSLGELAKQLTSLIMDHGGLVLDEPMHPMVRLTKGETGIYATCED